MKMLIKAMLVLLTMLLIGSCDNSTESKKDDMEPDSTTQSFTFEEYEFGDGSSSSYFNDVWVFDQNNIWAVGEVYHDPVIGGTNEYNIVQWNGSKWIGRGRGFNSAGIYGIWPVDSSHIYFAVGIVLEYKNGKFEWMDFSQLVFSQGQSVEHLWGSSESNIWGVGPWGTLVHYDGSKWTKLDISTEITFRDITGIKETDAAYAIGYNMKGETMIVELKEGGWNIIYNDKVTGETLSAWTLHGEGNMLYLADTKVWTFDLKTHERKILYTMTSGTNATAMAYVSAKDIYFWGPVYGGKEAMVHYNGKKFTEFGRNHQLSNHGGASAVKDICLRAAYSNNKALLEIVKRQQ